MADVITLSSGSEEDSDVEFVGVYSDTENKAEARPFIRGELVDLAAYPRIVIDITGQKCTVTPPRKRRRRDMVGPVQVVDISNYNLPGHSSPGPGNLEHQRDKTRERISKHKGPNTRCPVSLSHCPTDQELNEIKTGLKAEKKEMLESNPGSLRDSSLTGQPETLKSSVVDVLECPVKSLNVSKSGRPAKEAEATGCSLDQTTQGSQQYSRMYPQPLCETNKQLQCLKPENSKNGSNEIQKGDESRAEKHALEFMFNSDPAECPTSPTRCPTSSISCPTSLANFPTSPTKYPTLPTSCLTFPISCPTSTANCPTSPTRWPTSPISFPTPQISCPTSSTRYSTSPTSCPTYPTSCPTSTGNCPTSRTTGASQDHVEAETAWDGRDGEETGAEEQVSREDKRYVCPIQLRKLRPLMSGPIPKLEAEKEDENGVGDTEPLCGQNLSLVYSTVEEDYPEGTLQLLSDLLQPRFYPPVDITKHLLRDILLNPRCSDVLCLQAYSLLMRTQRHKHTDITTVPWDWELLTSVMAEELSNSKRFCCEVVGMLLQYVVQTMEDDFRVKLSFRNLHNSIAKANLSCSLRFNQVRDVMNWLFAAIVRSTGDNGIVSADLIKVKTPKELQKIIILLQKMLSLALEVDLSPVLNSRKLSEELFRMVIDALPLRHHRLLLLQTLESQLLRCKLTELLLHHASPQKTNRPVSQSLLLHFLHNATLTPDPTEVAESWKKWEELVQLLWMLLLSYEEVMNCHLRLPVSERMANGRNPIPNEHDFVLRLDVQEAVESFLSRAQKNMGQALPQRVHDFLNYLQDHLLAASQ